MKNKNQLNKLVKIKNTLTKASSKAADTGINTIKITYMATEKIASCSFILIITALYYTIKPLIKIINSEAIKSITKTKK